MGAHFYYYFVPYQPNIEAALEALRQQEFRAGRYNPVMRFVPFPITPASPAPGPQHDSPDDAFVDAGEEGTRSILDILYIAEEPEFGAAAPVPANYLAKLYGTPRPTRAQVESNMDFAENIERGEAIYITTYEDDEPTEILFAGYSCD